jgi:hypothetical protein
VLKSGVTSPNLLDIAMYEHPRIHAFEFLLELWVFSDELEEIIPCGKMNGDSMTWIRRDRPEGLGQNFGGHTADIRSRKKMFKMWLVVRFYTATGRWKKVKVEPGNTSFIYKIELRC